MDKAETQNGGVEPSNGTTDNDQATSSQEQKPRFPTFRFPPDETKTKILKILDKIRECNVNNEIDTPELVMCGKQSAGKSSVLEAITGLEFEKGDGGPCTRFVIEIRLFPDAKEAYIKSKVRFRPTPEEARTQGEEFEYKEKELPDCTDVGQIIAKAKAIMAITEKQKFSHHVLSIEYHFPDSDARISAPRLTLIDLPGLIAVDESYDLRGVTQRYIERDSALILAVVDAVNDPETHDILKMAQKWVIVETLFVHVLIDSDLTVPASKLEKSWLEHVSHPETSLWFKLGSHVLCNRDASQINPGSHFVDLTARNQKETAFFEATHRSPPNSINLGDIRRLPNGWHELDSKKWGVGNLRNRLCSLLSDMAVRKLGSIYNHIKVALKKREEDLGELQEKDPERHKDELKRMVYALRNLGKEGASGSYSEKRFFIITGDGPCWLRSKLADKGRTFSEEMRSKGHNSNEFKWKPDEKLPTDPMSADVSQMLVFLQRTQSGYHPGEFSPDRIPLVLREFSKPWTDLAKAFVDSCYSCCVEFAREAVLFVVKPIEILGKLQERKARAMHSLELIEDDRGDAALSMNPGIWMGSRELMADLSERLNKTAEPKQQTPTTPGRTQPVQTKPAQQSTQNTSHAKLGTQAKVEFNELDTVSRFNALKFLQNTLTLYVKCRETYIDNLLVQVVQRNLLRNFEDLFTHEWIDDKSKFKGIVEDPDRSGRLEKQTKLKVEVDILSWSLKELEPMIGKLSSL
ncbi:hypothetical protein B0O99DRAFT_743508 [Bisporella sp. PMI_857]|nr:hypothetical protein B0O99DRAFT_743508 [Bisporella sp. PMI_857]